MACLDRKQTWLQESYVKLLTNPFNLILSKNKHKCILRCFSFLFLNTILFVTSWASKDVVWNNMLEKDKTYTRDVHMMDNHPHLQPNMRAILLDWLMEVCSSSWWPR